MSRRDNNVRKLSFLGFHTKETSNDDPNEVHLDDEIERVFGSASGTEKERFELNRLKDDVILDNSPLKYDEAHRVPDKSDSSRPAQLPGTTRQMHQPDTASSASNVSNGGHGAKSPPTTTPTSPISFSSKSETTTTANNATLADNTSNDFSETVHDEPIVDQGTVQGEQWDTSARRNVHFDKDKKGAQIEGLPLEDTNEERRRRTE